MPRPACPFTLRSAVLVTLLLLVAALLVIIPIGTPAAEPPPPRAVPVAAPAPDPLPPQVRPGLPEGTPTRREVVPLRHLMKGLLLLIDEQHPLPEGYAPPDTCSIQRTSRGEVTCRDASAVLAGDALAALEALYAAARAEERIIQLTVFAGARSREQQRQHLTDTLALLSRDMPVEDALAAARSAVASPDCSEHQTGYAVDLRVCPTWNGWPDEGPLGSSAAGAWLCDNAWRFGFIRRWPDARPDGLSCRAYHFRYVGRAHAAIIHALGCTLEDYLLLLHTHGALTLYDENNVPAASAVCTVLQERNAVFHLPQDAAAEDTSMDNLGYAVAGCLYE